MSYEAWGDGDEFYGPELPEGWLNEEDAQELRDRITELEAQLSARDAQSVRDWSRAAPISEYHEDFGPVVWWALDDNGFWLGEPAWIGKPDDSDWPGYHTHWTLHPVFPEVPAPPQKPVSDVKP